MKCILFSTLLILGVQFASLGNQISLTHPHFSLSNINWHKTVSATHTSTITKLNLETTQKTKLPLIYLWVLHNDGCYYLGVVVEDLNPITGVPGLFWVPLTGTNYIGKTVECMSDEEFDNFC
jgi:hypothetical protein